MVAASMPVASTVTTMNTISLTSDGSGLHDCPTAVPRAIGPNSSVARSGTCVGRDAHLRADQRVDDALLLGAAGQAALRVDAGSRGRAVALPSPLVPSRNLLPGHGRGGFGRP